jgi:hypothetical protein
MVAAWDAGAIVGSVSTFTLYMTLFTLKRENFFTQNWVARTHCLACKFFTCTTIFESAIIFGLDIIFGFKTTPAI